MRKYRVKRSNGEYVYMSHIGINHAVGVSFGGLASSYNGVFDEEDNVNIESGIDDIRYCTIGDIKEAYEILKDSLINRKPKNFLEYSLCVEEAVLRYFGDYSNTKNRLSFFPDDEEVTIDGKKQGKVSDLAHQNAAMCVERAMLSQNLLKTLGIDSTYKASGIINNGKNEGHAYNLVAHDGKYYIFDATIPTICDNEISPIICEIPEDVYEKISNPSQDIGISVHVSHYNPLQKKDYDITYDAGRKEVYEINKDFTK